MEKKEFRVIHNYTPEEWEKQYSPAHWIEGYTLEEILTHSYNTMQSESLKVTEAYPDVFQMEYDDKENAKIDIFGDKSFPSDAPIFGFFHGGGWKLGSRDYSRYLIPKFQENKIVCAVFGYSFVSETVLIPDIVAEVQKGIHALLKYARERGSRGVYLCGHSAGAHLLLAALSCAKPDSVNYDLIKGLFPISGVFDLSAALPSNLLQEVKVTQEIADSCSPLHDVDKLKKNIPSKIKTLVIVAEKESEAMFAQSEVLMKALKHYGFDSDLMIVKNTDHFFIILDFIKPDYIVTQTLLQHIKGK